MATYNDFIQSKDSSILAMRRKLEDQTNRVAYYSQYSNIPLGQDSEQT